MVASLHTITHSRPSMRPMPVMMPAPWIASSYMPLAASGESSRNGVPGSIRRSTRSRGSSLPRDSVALARTLPARRARPRRGVRSSSCTSARIAAALARNSLPCVSIAEASFATAPSPIPDCRAHYGVARARSECAFMEHHKSGTFRGTCWNVPVALRSTHAMGCGGHHRRRGTMKRTLLVSVAALALAAGSTIALSQGSGGGEGGGAAPAPAARAHQAGGGRQHRPDARSGPWRAGPRGPPRSSRSAQQAPSRHAGADTQPAPGRARAGPTTRRQSQRAAAPSKSRQPSSRPSRRRPAAPSRAQTGDQAGRGRAGRWPSSNVSLTTEQKTTIRTKVLDQLGAARDQRQLRHQVGTVVPRTVRIAPVPVDADRDRADVARLHVFRLCRTRSSSSSRARSRSSRCSQV